jgi:hypothetical protein
MGIVKPENNCMQNYIKYYVTFVGHEDEWGFPPNGSWCDFIVVISSWFTKTVSLR